MTDERGAAAAGTAAAGGGDAATPTRPGARDDREAEVARLRAVAEAQPAFSRFLGIRITSWSTDCVEAELLVREELANRNGVLHGGAIMALADNLGGTAASLNLPPGARTTTVESKSNFFRAVPLGTVARARCVPLHRGRTTTVWQTTVATDDGRPAAVVTQTQLVLHPAD